MNNIIFEVSELLFALSKKTGSAFGGSGIIVYNSKILLNNYYCALRPNLHWDENHYLGDPKLVDYLYMIGNIKHPFHDGFHMINEEGRLTHVSQYFAPPIVHRISPNPRHGARVHSSICGSLLEGVIAIGVISSNNNIYLYKDGEELDLNGYSSSTCLFG